MPDGRVIVSILVFAISIVYLPDVGHGFVKDDFGWIAKSHIASWSDVQAAFGVRERIVKVASCAADRGPRVGDEDLEAAVARRGSNQR